VVNELKGDDASSTTVLREIFNSSNKLKGFKTDFSVTVENNTNILDKPKKIKLSEANALKQKFRSYYREKMYLILKA
jgi:hypothetical protein